MLRFFLNQPLNQWLTWKKSRKTKIQKCEYLENEKSFLDEIIRWKNKHLMTQVVDTNFKEYKRLYNYTLHHTIDTCEITYLGIFMHALAASFEKNMSLWNCCFMNLKDKPIQTKKIPFSEITSKIKVVFGRTSCLILLTLAVDI